MSMASRRLGLVAEETTIQLVERGVIGAARLFSLAVKELTGANRASDGQQVKTFKPRSWFPIRFPKHCLIRAHKKASCQVPDTGNSSV